MAFPVPATSCLPKEGDTGQEVSCFIPPEALRLKKAGLDV